MSFARKNLGYDGEKLAADYLEKQNYKILARNVRYKQGEIDILAQDKKQIVLVEVKTKTIFDQGTPEEMVNFFKQRKLCLLGKVLLQKYPGRQIRSDVVAVDLCTDRPAINHIIDAVNC